MYTNTSAPSEHALAVTTDSVVFRVSEHTLELLLIRRRNEPFAGHWALPGGFVEPGETLKDCVSRELLEETGAGDDVYLEQLYTFGDPGRDPRGRTVSVAYLGLVAYSEAQAPAAATDAEAAQWFPVDRLPALAFDHTEIIGKALERLRSKLRYSTIALKLSPEHFTLSELQRVYEVILDRALDKRNFRKQILGLGVVEPTGERQRNGNHRPAMLFKAANTGEIQVFR